MSAYDDAAEVYVASDLWPIPVTAEAGNVKPVHSATGYNHEVSYGKVNAWLHSDPAARRRAGRTEAHSNIAIRHDMTLAIDVDDAYGVKSGVARLAEFAEKHGLPPLPPTWSSTARGPETGSRQYLYRVPERVPMNTKPCDSVELCNWHHRFTVCAPSVHPKTGTEYAWYLPGDAAGVPPSWGEQTGRFPRPELFAELPREWFDAFRGTTQLGDQSIETTHVSEFMAKLPPGPPNGLVAGLIRKWSDPQQHVGHDECLRGLINAFMLGREGHPGVPELAEVLIARHRAYLQSDRPEVLRSTGGQLNELDSLVAAACDIAQRKPLTVQPVIAATPDVASTTAEFLGVDMPDVEDQEGGAPFADAGSTTLPDEFWESRPSLSHIRQAAYARNRSATVVLLATLARLASLQSHETRVDTGLSTASLNMMICAVGPAGAGKTSGLRIARELIVPPFAIAGADGYRDGVPLGSGEGVAELFMGEAREEHPTETMKDGSPKYVKVRKQVRHNAYAAVDEGETLFRLAERSGSTLMTTLRSAWVGETIGQANASAESTRIIKEGQYSLGLVIGVQPVKAGPLFDDAAGGTPQRFCWAHTSDPDIPEEAPEHPGELLISTSTGPRNITVVDSIKARIRAEDRAANTGELVRDPLDTHEPLHLAKLGALLATLDGRDEVTEDDWDLAKQVWAMSCAVRNGVIQAVKRTVRAQQVEAYQRDAERRLVVAQAEETHEEKRADSTLVAAAISMGRRVWKVGYCSRADLNKAIAGRAKTKYGPGLVSDAIELAVQRGYIAAKEQGFGPGEVGPGDG